MDSRERFDETSLPDKNEYYSSLNMKNITYVLKMSMKIFQMMLKNDLVHQIMKSIDHFLHQKIKR